MKKKSNQARFAKHLWGTEYLHLVCELYMELGFHFRNRLSIENSQVCVIPTRAHRCFFFSSIRCLDYVVTMEKREKMWSVRRFYDFSCLRGIGAYWDAWMEFNHVDNNDEEIDIWKKTRDFTWISKHSLEALSRLNFVGFFRRVGFSFPSFISSLSYCMKFRHEIQLNPETGDGIK